MTHPFLPKGTHIRIKTEPTINTHMQGYEAILDTNWLPNNPWCNMTFPNNPHFSPTTVCYITIYNSMTVIHKTLNELVNK